MTDFQAEQFENTIWSSTKSTTPNCVIYMTPGGIRNALTHIRQLPPMHNYHAQSAEKGQPCVIEVTPEQAEFLNYDQRG